MELGDVREWKVEAVRQVDYRVALAASILDPANTALAEALTADREGSMRRLVVVDDVISALYGEQINEYMGAHGFEATIVVLAATEPAKNWDSVQQVLAAMDEMKLDRRREPVIGIGGGVLLDIVGFAASVYRRGTPYVRIPTTLIGLVDAGVGVKTGVNHRDGKNKIGTYAHADMNLCDPAFLATLPKRHLVNGMAEILKVALMKSADLFELMEQLGGSVVEDKFQRAVADPSSAEHTVLAAAIQLMLEELQPNLWESKLERCVDYGHTFSPVIEMHALPELLHGEAVCIDMALTTAIARGRGLLSESDAERTFAYMRAIGLPIWADFLTDSALLHEALMHTVRHRDGKQRLPLPVGIGGHTFVDDVTNAEIDAAVRHLQVLERGLTRAA
ncbi:MAG TPA: sedoheptulose 7-phosphate cyclase [Lentzea sp.]